MPSSPHMSPVAAVDLSGETYMSMPSASLPDGKGIFHEAVYAKIEQSSLREKLSSAYFFEVVVIKQGSDRSVGGTGKVGRALLKECASCPPRRGLMSDPLRLDRGFRQAAISRGTEGLESLVVPWEQHDAGVGIVEVKLKALPLPPLAMRQNHVVFNVPYRNGGTVTCVLGGTLHPMCEVPRDLRGATLDSQMPFAFGSSLSDSWYHSDAPFDIYKGCITGSFPSFQDNNVYVLVQEPLASGGFVDRLIRMEFTFGNHRDAMKMKWSDVFRSTTMQVESAEPDRSFHSSERFMVVDRVNGKDRIHISQSIPHGVAVFEWAVGSPTDEWVLRGKATTNKTNTDGLLSYAPIADRGVTGTPVYHPSSQSLCTIRLFPQALGEDELWFIPRTAGRDGGFRPRVGNVLRATAAGSEPLFEVCPMSRRKLTNVDPLIDPPVDALNDYQHLHLPRDLEGVLSLQDEIYDQTPEERAPMRVSSGESWALSRQNSSEASVASFEGPTDAWGGGDSTCSAPMGELMFSGSRSLESQSATSAFYQLVEEVSEKTTHYFKARAIRARLLATARDLIAVVNTTGAPIHMCAGMTSEQFQKRVIRPMKQFLKSMGKGGYSFDMDENEEEAPKQPASHSRGVNANFVQPSDLMYRWAVAIPAPANSSERGELLMLGIAKMEEARQRGMLAARCPDASNSNTLKSIAAKWMASC